MIRLAAPRRRLSRPLTDAVDRLFGYDVFVAHRRADAAAYAARLVERLDEEKLSSFIDQREYGPGDDLSAATIRHIRRATMLVVIGSPAILQSREPDWVLREIDAYLGSRPPHQRRLLPIDFGATLAGAAGRSPIADRLADTIRIDEPLEALEAGPSAAVVGAITQQFRKRRRESVRLRVFQGIAATLAVLALLAGTLAWLATSALRDARRNLAENYMTAARARLDAGFGDEAAALAAESLRNFDSAEARRLIVEHPPLDLSGAYGSEVEGIFAFDVDPAGRHVALVGYQGVAALQSLDPAQPALEVRSLGSDDLWSVSFTPDGLRLLIGDDSGRVHMRAADDLERPVCADLPRLDGRVDRFLFHPQRRALLVRADDAIYSLSYDGVCASGPARLLYRSTHHIDDFVIDQRNDRLLLTQEDGLVAVSLSEPATAPPRFHPMPLAAGRTERPRPTRIALHPRTNEVVVFPLGGEELFFLDGGLAVAGPVAVRPFGPDRPGALHAFGFSANGDRLVLVGDDGHALVWSTAGQRLERRLRLHEAHAQLAILRSDSLVTIGRDGTAGQGFRRTMRIIGLDPPARSSVDLAAQDRAEGDTARSLDGASAGTSVAIGTRRGRVLSLAARTGTLTLLGRDSNPITWVGAAPHGGGIAYLADGGTVTIVRDGTNVRQEALLDRSPTGLYSAAWLKDGSALVVGGGWTHPMLIPADPAAAVMAGPQVVNGSVDGIVPGPDGQVLLREDRRTWIWDTRENVMRSVDLVGREDLALIDIAAWGDDGVAALTRNGLFLRRWTGRGDPGDAFELPVRGDRLAVSGNGRRLAAFQRGQLSIHDLPDGRLRATLAFQGGDVHAAAFTADGSILIAATRTGPLVRWSLRALDQPATELADSVQLLTGHALPGFSLALPSPAARAPDPARRR